MSYFRSNYSQLTTAKQKRFEDIGGWTCKEAGKPSGILKAEVLILKQICEKAEEFSLLNPKKIKRETLQILSASNDLFLERIYSLTMLTDY